MNKVVPILEKIYPVFHHTYSADWGFALGAITSIPNKKDVVRNPLSTIFESIVDGALCSLGARIVVWLLPPPFKVAVPICCASSIAYHLIFGRPRDSVMMRFARNIKVNQGDGIVTIGEIQFKRDNFTSIEEQATGVKKKDDEQKETDI